MNLVAHFSLSVFLHSRLMGCLTKLHSIFISMQDFFLFPPLWPLTKYILHPSAVTNVVLCHSWTDPIYFFFFWSSHKVVRVNDLIFFPPSLANWLLQGGLNRPAWLYYQNTAFPGLFYLDFKRGGSQRVLQRLKGDPGSQLSACPLCCHPLPEPLFQPLLWECCGEAPQTHLAKQCGQCASAVGMLLGSWAEEDPGNKGEGWMLQPTLWHPARDTYPLPSRACVGKPPCDFSGKQMEFCPKVINDSLAVFAAMTSWALHKHQRKPCPENSHPEKANKRGKPSAALHKAAEMATQVWDTNQDVLESQGDVSIAPPVQCWALQKAPHHKYDSTLWRHTVKDQPGNLLSPGPKHHSKSCSHRADTTAGCPECQSSWIPTCSPPCGFQPLLLVEFFFYCMYFGPFSKKSKS